MQELTLKAAPISKNTKKDGTPLVGKFGPYFIIRAETVEEGYVSWFGKVASDLQAGDKIKGKLEVKVDGQYTNKNFTFAKEEDVLLERIAKLESRVMKLELAESRIQEDVYSKVKSDLVLELTGKFNTTADYKKITAPHPKFTDTPDDIPLDAYKDEPTF